MLIDYSMSELRAKVQITDEEFQQILNRGRGSLFFRFKKDSGLPAVSLNVSNVREATRNHVDYIVINLTPNEFEEIRETRMKYYQIDEQRGFYISLPPRPI